MFAEVVHIDGDLRPGDERLQLVLVEQTQPVERHHGTQALSESLWGGGGGGNT